MVDTDNSSRKSQSLLKPLLFASSVILAFLGFPNSADFKSEFFEANIKILVS